MNISQLFKTSPYSIIFLSVCPDINMFFSEQTFFNVSWKPIYLRFLKCFTCVQFPGCSQKYLFHLKPLGQIHKHKKYLGWRNWLLFSYTLFTVGGTLTKGENQDCPPQDCLHCGQSWVHLPSGLPTPIITLIFILFL